MSAKKRVNYTRKSLEHMRKNGYIAEVVEKWVANYHGNDEARKKAMGYRKDLFGCIDILAIHTVTGNMVAVQSTSKAQINPHLKKIEALPNIDVIRLAPWRMVIHGWHKPRHRYELVEVDFKTRSKYAEPKEPVPETGDLF